MATRLDHVKPVRYGNECYETRGSEQLTLRERKKEGVRVKK